MPGWLLISALVLMPSAGADDPLPPGAVARLGSARLRPLAPARAVAFSPDGLGLATASDGGMVQVWDPATGRQRWSTSQAHDVEGSGLWGPSVAWTADGQSLIIPGEGDFHFVDPASGALQRSVGPPPHGDRFRLLSVSSDGRLLCTSSGGPIIFWDADRARELHRRWTPTPNLTALRPDDRHLLLATGANRVALLDWRTGRRVHTLQIDRPALGIAQAVGEEPPPILAASRDGRLAAIAGAAPVVTLFALPEGKALRHIELGSSFAAALALTADGRLLAVAVGGGVRIFATASGDPLRRMDRPGGRFSALAFAPDGRRLAGVGADGSLHLWDVTDGREVFPAQGHPVSVQALLWLAGGTRLASWDSQGRLIVWDPATARPIDGCPDLKIKAASLIADAEGRGVQGLGEDAELFTWQPGTLPHGQRSGRPAAAERILALGDGGRRMVYRTADGSLWVHAPDFDRRLVTVRPFSVDHITFSADGTRVAGESEGRPMVWDCASGREVSSLDERPPGVPQRLLLAPDGRSLLLQFSRQVRIVEVLTGEERLSCSVESVTAAFWSRDGRWLAAGTEDGAVRIHDAATGRVLLQREARQGVIAALAFSPDDRLLASGGLDGLVFIWKTPDRATRRPTLTARRQEVLWDRLAADAPTAVAAMAELSHARAEAVAFLRERIGELFAGPDPRRVEQLLIELDSDDFDIRQRAQRELASAGAAIEDRLHRALKSTSSPEARRRLQQLLAPLRSGMVPPHRVRAVRAVEVLEQIGTPEAGRLLQEMASRATDPRLALEIRDSLRRLGGNGRCGEK